jgi:hypothetical protein
MTKPKAPAADPALKLDRNAILDALERFIRQRPGLEPGNYDRASYLSDSRMIQRQRREAETLLAAVRWRTGIDTPALVEAFRGAYSGRLNLSVSDKGTPALDYCTGQYFCTEYRAAACSVLSSALWTYTREHAMPAPIAHTVDLPSEWVGDKFVKQTLTPKPVGIHKACELKNGNDKASISDLYRTPGGDKLISAGDWMRAHFRKEFGRGIAARWFN